METVNYSEFCLSIQNNQQETTSQSLQTIQSCFAHYLLLIILIIHIALQQHSQSAETYTDNFSDQLIACIDKHHHPKEFNLRFDHAFYFYYYQNTLSFTLCYHDLSVLVLIRFLHHQNDPSQQTVFNTDIDGRR